MPNKTRIIGNLAGLGLVLGVMTHIVLAQEHKKEMPISTIEQTSKFQKIEQPLALKLAVITGGVGLIAAELWWFTGSKNRLK